MASCSAKESTPSTGSGWYGEDETCLRVLVGRDGLLIGYDPPAST